MCGTSNTRPKESQSSQWNSIRAAALLLCRSLEVILNAWFISLCLCPSGKNHSSIKLKTDHATSAAKKKKRLPYFFSCIVMEISLESESRDVERSAPSRMKKQNWETAIVAFYWFARYCIHSAWTVLMWNAFGERSWAVSFGHQWNSKTSNLAAWRARILKSDMFFAPWLAHNFAFECLSSSTQK